MSDTTQPPAHETAASAHVDAGLRAFLEAAPDAIVVVDAEGRITTVNHLAERMFGYTGDELLGKRVEVLVPERLHADHQRYRGDYLREPRTRPMGEGRELSGRRRDGSEFTVEISLSPIRTDRGTLVISIIRDTTQRRAAEAKFRGLLESAPDGIVVVDAGGTIVIVNSQTERMFGYDRDELVGKHVELLVPDRFRPRHGEYRSDYFRAPRTRPMGAGRLLAGRKRDGTEFPVEISLSPLETEQGVLVTSIIRDITDRRRAEELIQASLREKEVLLKEIHHRVKNNLQVTSSLLKLQSQYIHDSHAAELFAESQHRIRSMALVHEKLYESRELARIDLGDYTRSLAELLFRSFGVDRRRIALEVEAEEQFLSIETAVPCGLILNELLSNCLKHAFPGERTGAIRVVIANQHGQGFSFSVADDGVGLSAQLDVMSAETLGLQLVRTLVEQLRARLEVEGTAGTRFRVVVPEVRA